MDLSTSYDGTVCDTQLTSTSRPTLMGAVIKPSFFKIDTPASYEYYKFSILASEGTVAGQLADNRIADWSIRGLVN